MFVFLFYCSFYLAQENYVLKVLENCYYYYTNYILSLNPSVTYDF